MRTNLTVADLGDLLDQPLIATLATYRLNREVLLSPLWFEWQDGGFNLVVGRNDFKTKHIHRDAAPMRVGKPAERIVAALPRRDDLGLSHPSIIGRSVSARVGVSQGGTTRR